MLDMRNAIKLFVLQTNLGCYVHTGLIGIYA